MSSEHGNVTVLNFEFRGIPTAKQSFRFAQRENAQGHTYVQKYTPADVQIAESNIRAAIQQQLPPNFVPWDGAILFRVQYVFPPPKSFKKKKLEEMRAGKRFYKTTKPDISDNLNKGVCDAMQGVIYLNDSQICQIFAEKIYGDIPITRISMQHIQE